MVKSLRKALDVLLALILVIISLNGICGGAFGAPASVASNVLEDLQRDDSFNLDDYPAYTVYDDSSAEGFYRLEVIQIAESTDGELLVYVYAPAAQLKPLVASSINIARSKDNTVNLSFDNYKLEFLNNAGVLYKYKVLNFKLEESNVRYYNISNILRPFNSVIDKPPVSGTISEVENEVGQTWTVWNDGGSVSYSMTVSETVLIKDKVVGYVSYEGGWSFAPSWKECDSYFVAFSTNWDIDRLIDADVEFYKRSMERRYVAVSTFPTTTWEEHIKYTSDPTKEVVHLRDIDKAHFEGGGWGQSSYSWNRINTKDDFIINNETKNYKITTEGKNNLEGTQWVLQFYEFQVTAQAGFSNRIRYTGEATDVMILRLKFEKDGQIYNLGAVDNKQSGDGSRFNSKEKESLGNILADIIKTIGKWIADMLRIPAWLGTAAIWTVIILVALLAVSIVVKIIRNIQGTTAPPNSDKQRTSTRKNTNRIRKAKKQARSKPNGK